MSSGPTDENKIPEDVLNLLNKTDRDKDFTLTEMNAVTTPLSLLQMDMATMMGAFGQITRLQPDSPNVTAEELKLRIALIREEAKELVDALESGDFENAAKEIIDVLVVTIGAANTLGLALDPLWAIVFENNLTKASGPTDPETGKRLKPEGYVPCDEEIVQEMVRQGWKR